MSSAVEVGAAEELGAERPARARTGVTQRPLPASLARPASRTLRVIGATMAVGSREGELTELTIGNLVVEIDGELVTPPRDAGLLAGTMRAELLDRGEVREAILRREDLGRARRLWLVNSLRGWVPIRMV